MKKLIFVFVLVLSLVFMGPAFAVKQADERSMIGKWWKDSSGFTATELPDDFDFTIGFKIFVYASADDTVTVAITANDDEPLYSGTTDDATNGDWLILNSMPIPPGSKIAVTVSSGTASVFFASMLF